MAAAPAVAQSADCVGIVPTDLGSAATYSTPFRYNPDASCSYATSDQNGYIATEAHTLGGYSWWVVAPDGTATVGAFSTEAPNLIPQASGFEGVYRDPRAFGSVDLSKWDTNGAGLSQTPRGGDTCGLETWRSSEGGALGLFTCGARRNLS